MKRAIIIGTSNGIGKAQECNITMAFHIRFSSTAQSLALLAQNDKSILL